MEKVLEHCLTIATSKSGMGGIASVISAYNDFSILNKTICTTKSGHYFGKFLDFVSAIFKLIYVFLTNKEIKITHIHSASYYSFFRKSVFFLLSKAFNKVIIFHIHGAEFHRFYFNSSKNIKYLIEFVINNSDCIVCLSTSWEKFFIENFKPRKIIIIPNIINSHIICKKSAITIRNKKIQFLFLGHLTRRKGIYDLFEVLLQNKEQLNEKMILHVCGNGSIDNTYQSKIEEMKNMVKLHGWIGPKEKLKFFSDCDVLILPSYNEGLPLAILEALANRLPVITTNVGGIPEIVNSNNGILISPGDKTALLNGILFFINNPDLIINYGLNGFNQIQPYLPNNVKSKIISLYTELINELEPNKAPSF